MAQLRERAIASQIVDKAKLWPVLGLLGPRQVGKSTLLKQICGSNQYINLDLQQLRDEATKAPDFFIASHRTKKGLLGIDEIQKAPKLFDAIKASVDESRRPGAFILAGSTEFSSKVGIRESLTGRIGLMRVWPLSLAEMCQHKHRVESVVLRKPKPTSTASEITRRFECGGMPGFCFVRNENERDALIEGWLETTCYRDLEQIVGLSVRGDKVRLALKLLATHPDLTISDLSKALVLSVPTVRKMLEALEILMVMTRIPPHPLGVGKDRWLICDTAIAKYLGAPRRIIEQTALHQEILCQYSFAGLTPPTVSYYKTTRGSFVDFIIEDKKGLLPILIVDSASPKAYELRALTSLMLKLGAANAGPWCIGPFSHHSKMKSGIVQVPWTFVL